MFIIEKQVQQDIMNVLKVKRKQMESAIGHKLVILIKQKRKLISSFVIQG
jgi:hypothetical protein